MGAPGEPSSPSATVAFHYIKSNQFRVIHVDGALGGITPKLGIHMALYSERLPIPQKVVHDLVRGELKEPAKEVISREGVVREVEAEILLDLDTAKGLSAWLNDQVTKAEALRSAGTK